MQVKDARRQLEEKVKSLDDVKQQLRNQDDQIKAERHAKVQLHKVPNLQFPP